MTYALKITIVILLLKTLGGLNLQIIFLVPLHSNFFYIILKLIET